MNVPEDKLAPIKAAILSGQKISAIKLYRAATSAELVDAKNEVEKIEAELRRTSPNEFKVAPAGKGCLGLLMISCIVAVTLVWFCVGR